MPARRTTGPVNVRGEIVGDAGAEELHIENDRTALATMVLGGVLLVIAVVVLVQAARLDNRGETVGAGHRPWVVGVLLLLVGVADGDPRPPRHGRLGGLRAHHRPGLDAARRDAGGAGGLRGRDAVPRLRRLGDAAVRRDRHRAGRALPGASFAYGFCVAALVYLAFDVGIGISLPAGPWGF